MTCSAIPCPSRVILVCAEIPYFYFIFFFFPFPFLFLLLPSLFRVPLLAPFSSLCSPFEQLLSTSNTTTSTTTCTLRNTLHSTTTNSSHLSLALLCRNMVILLLGCILILADLNPKLRPGGKCGPGSACLGGLPVPNPNPNPIHKIEKW